MAVNPQLPHPEAYETDVVLRDGSTVHVRPIRPADEASLLTFLEGLSVESRAFRFFSAAANLALAARREANLDYLKTFGLVATAGADPHIVGHAGYRAVGERRAEVAFAVANAFLGRGLGTLLLGQLAEIASGQGIQEFEAEVMPANYRMLEVFRESGLLAEVTVEPEQIRVTMPTSLTEEARERFERREQIAAVNALDAFFRPRSVAVIGASRERGTPGGEVFHNLLTAEFNGPVYPVNPSATVVQSVTAFPSVEEVPGPVGLAVIIVPARHVLEVAQQCARKGVRSLVVISAGFAEVDDEGRTRQADLVQFCRATGMRLVGPNCIGIANTDPAVRLNATFGPIPPVGGRVGFSTQSGALGLAAIDYAGALGLGISRFVSVGNKADISGNDLLNYWESDPDTDVILLYLESFGNPRKFSRIARRVAKQKPIVVVKSGRSAAGARATTSHTGALLGASDVTVDALFRQSGVIRTETLEEMFNAASLLVHQPLPRGPRVGIVTNVGGPGILCADACEAHGLEVPVLGDETRERLRVFLPAVASVGNPVDMIASATPEQYRQAIQAVASDPNVDAVIVIFIPPLRTESDEVARALVDAANAAETAKPIMAVFMSSRGMPPELRQGSVHIPSYAFPETAAIALAHAARYAEWRQRPPSLVPLYDDVQHDQAGAIVASALRRGGGWLEPDEVRDLLTCYGLPVVSQRVAATPAEVGQLAEEAGGEVVLKAVTPAFQHKSDAGLVRLRLQGRQAAEAAAEAMSAIVTEAGHAAPSFLLQPMIAGGVEMILGLVHDPQFGPVAACGAGGTLVELLKDVSVGLTPLTSDDASRMVRSLKTLPLLEGFRGAPPADVRALEDALLRLSTLAEDLAQVAELDLNPIVVQPQGAVVLDARVRVQDAPPRSPIGARR